MNETIDPVKLNLISYIGLIKVYKKSLLTEVKREMLYDVKLCKSDKGNFLLRHRTGPYMIIPSSDILTISEISKEEFFDNVIAIVDVEIRPDRDNITSVNDFNLRLSKIPKVPFSDIDKLFYSFRRALTKKIHVDRLRTQRQISYLQKSPNLIELDEIISGIDNISGSIGGLSVDLMKHEYQTWKLKKNQNIPKTGTFIFNDPTNNFEYNIFKFKKFRQVLNDPQIPSSPISRIRSLLNNYNVDLGN